MQLEDYLDFQGPNDIRVKGTRIGIETILTDYLERGLYAEEIAARYRVLSLEQAYAVLAYYWRNQIQVDAYLHSVNSQIERQRQTQALAPSPAVLRMREIARLRDKSKPIALAVAP